MKESIEKLKAKSEYDINDLVEIMRILRSEDGCPWDREQDHHSIRRNLIEETYEVVEAIDEDSSVMLLEELGDLLLQIVFHAQISEEDHEFKFDHVADGVCRKLILRHPHIFGDVIAETSEEVLKNWDAIKTVEKDQKTDRDVLASVSKALPALIRADKLCSKAKKLGYEIPSNPDLSDMAAGLEEADAAEKSAFIGELLMSVVSLSRELGVDGEKALSDACGRLVDAARD